MRGVGTAGRGDYLIVVGEGPCHLWACGDNVPRSAGCGLRAPWTCAPVTASEGSRLPLSLERLARGGGGQDRARPPAASGPGAPTLFSHGARREHCARSLSPLLPVRGPFAFPSLSTIFWPKDPQVTGLRPRACANPKTKGAAGAPPAARTPRCVAAWDVLAAPRSPCPPGLVHTPLSARHALRSVHCPQRRPRPAERPRPWAQPRARAFVRPASAPQKNMPSRPHGEPSVTNVRS